MLKRTLILAFIILSCDEIVIEPTNPLDPNSPDYTVPEINILSPSDNVTIKTSSIAFTWEGNKEGMLFRYAVDSNWSDWNNNKSVQIDHFDEGPHSFSAQSKYTTEVSSSIVTINFEVDAVEGPALLFKPRAQKVNQGNSVRFEVLAEEVESLTAAAFNLLYDPNLITIDSVNVGTFFPSSGETLFHHSIDITQGRISIITALLSSGDTSVEGTGSLAIIKATLKSATTASITFDGKEVFRNPNNQDITIQTAIGGILSNN